MWRFPVFLSVAGLFYVSHNLLSKSHQEAVGYYGIIKNLSVFIVMGRAALPRNGTFISKDGCCGCDRSRRKSTVTRAETKKAGAAPQIVPSWGGDPCNRLPPVITSIVLFFVCLLSAFCWSTHTRQQPLYGTGNLPTGNYNTAPSDPLSSAYRRSRTSSSIRQAPRTEDIPHHFDGRMGILHQHFPNW